MVKHKNGNFNAAMNELALIKTKHLFLTTMKINDIASIKREVLTCVYDTTFELESESELQNRNNVNYSKDDEKRQENNEMNIQTLRLKNFSNNSSVDICTNKSIIESCNLNNSLKNVVLQLDTGVATSLNLWKDAITSILKKTYYSKLENIILSLTSQPKFVYWIFKILKEHQHLWKYQLKQISVALDVTVEANTQSIGRRYYIFKWDSSIKNTDKFLTEQQEICDGEEQDQFTKEKMRNQIDQLLNTWL